MYADYIGNKILLYDTLQSSVMIEEFEGKVKLKNRINFTSVPLKRDDY